MRKNTTRTFFAKLRNLFRFNPIKNSSEVFGKYINPNLVGGRGGGVHGGFFYARSKLKTGENVRGKVVVSAAKNNLGLYCRAMGSVVEYFEKSLKEKLQHG